MCTGVCGGVACGGRKLDGHQEKVRPSRLTEGPGRMSAVQCYIAIENCTLEYNCWAVFSQGLVWVKNQN